ncbi:hypothetical protein C8R45DRAFT_190544 [Mycena sanguinolenta]|nr:hypothetical protein C8R45DRAFT_190544 [Mycena sanguinolenta]
MDPISITGMVISIGQVVQVLFEYGSSVKSATRDTHSLAAELLAIRGVLELINAQQRGGATKIQPELTQLLTTASESVASLHQRLGVDGQSGRLERLVQRGAWPFKQDDVRRQLGRLERVKMCLMMAMTSETMSQNDDLVSALAALRISFDEEREVSKQLRENKEFLDLLQWLSPTMPKFKEAHSRALAAHLPATSAWFEDGPLQQLLDLDTTVGRVMVIHGKSGSGKTTLLAYLIELLRSRKLQDDGPFPVAYAYCSFSDRASQDPLNILGAITGQLANTVPELLEYLKSVFPEDEQQRRPRSLALPHLAAKLVEACRNCKLVFVLVDAINESAHLQSIQEMLFNLASKAPNLRIVATSTASQARFFQALGPGFIETEIHQGGHIRDIAVFVDSVVRSNLAFSALEDELKEKLSQTICDRADGMFRFAKFQLDHLSLQRTVRGVKHALDSMPFGLNEAYAAILRQVPSHSEDFQLLRRSLMWLSFAAVPLYLDQLAEAVTVEEDSTAPDPDNRLGNPTILLDLAQGLLSLDRETGIVTLAHPSVKTFLTSGWRESGTDTTTVSAFALSPADAHNTILRACITYLRYEVPAFQDDSHDCIDTRDVLARHPFMPYAAKWPLHAAHMTAREWALVENGLFATRSGASYWWWIRGAELRYTHVAAIVRTTPPLYYAASFGWADLVVAILKFDAGIDVDARGGSRGSTPLEVAAYRSHLAVVKILLRAGANPWAPNIADKTYALDWIDKSWADEELLELLRGCRVRKMSRV